MYLYYAAIERKREDTDTRPIPDTPWTVLFKRLTGRKSSIVRPPGAVQATNTKSRHVGNFAQRLTRRGNKRAVDDEPQVPVDEFSSAHEPKTNFHNDGGVAESTDGLMSVLSQREQDSAYRLLRSSSWQVVFFLIMTDVLGWYTAPMAFNRLGYGPGVLVYTFFYLLAFASGQILWRLYMNMDSERYPIKCYADLGERTYGPVIKHLFTVLQSLQLLV